jgi:hypothetical protein
MKAKLLLPDGKPPRTLEIERLKVRLRLREPVFFHFQHGGVLHGLLCRIFGHDLPAGLFPMALESGHVSYARGDAYDFVVSAVGGSRDMLSGLAPALERMSQEKGRKGAATLEGNFAFEGAETIPKVELEELVARARSWQREGKVRILFPSPLRLKLSPELQKPGAGYMNRDVFPADLFLDRLWRRFYQLEGGEFPESGAMPALPRGVTVRVEDLTWMDMPVRGRLEGKPGKPKGTTLGGVVGSVVMEGLPLPWLLLLALMEGAGVGSSAHYGFGLYSVGETPSWRRPARTYEELLGAKAEEVGAVVAALTPSALAILDDGAAFFRMGLSRFSAPEGVRRARAAGMGDMVAGAGTRFVMGLEEETVMARLEALWPGEPLISQLGGWMGRRGDSAELAKFVGKVFASELALAMREESKCIVRFGGQLRVLGKEEALDA